jgi:hypothetical protein
MQMKFLILAIVFTQHIAAQTSDNPYDAQYPSSEGLHRVKYNNMFGFINEKGREVIALKFAAADDFRNGFAEVSMDGKRFGYIDPGGRTVLPLEYHALLYGFQDGYTPAKKDGKWGMVNVKGKTIVPHRYDYLYYFSDGLALVRKDDANGTRYGFVNDKGIETIPLIYEDASVFEDGLAAVSSNGKYGFIDVKGNIVIPFQYESAKGFSHGRAAVKLNGYWGFIDKGNKLSIPAIYSEVRPFTSEEAEVCKGTDCFYINTDGKKLKPGRWLLLFTKGQKAGEQYWYRNDVFSDLLPKKYQEGFRFYDVMQNQHEKEIFVVMAKPGVGWQSGLHHKYSTKAAWDRIKELSNEQRSITSIAYGMNKWTFVASEVKGRSAETVIKDGQYPAKAIAQARKQGKSITSLAYGDGTWFVVMRTEPYGDQIVKEYEYDRWNQADVNQFFKNGYAITDMVKVDATYTVVFTKGTGIKEQLLLWNDELPLREIKSYWDKGYKSYKSFYLPRYISINNLGLNF